MSRAVAVPVRSFSNSSRLLTGVGERAGGEGVADLIGREAERGGEWGHVFDGVVEDEFGAGFHGSSLVRSSWPGGAGCGGRRDRPGVCEIFYFEFTIRGVLVEGSIRCKLLR